MRLALYALAAVSLLACRDTTAPAPIADVSNAALLSPIFSSQSMVELPMNPRAGVPFELRINSFGEDGCWSFDRTEVITDGQSARITPYNRNNATATTGCTQAIVRIPHFVSLTFATPGPKELLIRGRDFQTRAPAQYPITLVVQP